MNTNNTTKQLLEKINTLEKELSELKKSDEAFLYKKALNTSSDLISLIDKNYTFLMVNDMYVKYHKKSREEIIGNTIENVISKKSFLKVKGAIDKCLTGKTLEFEDWFEEETFGKKYVRVTYTPFKENDIITGILIKVTDITERKSAETKLLASNQKWELALQCSEMGLWDWNMLTNEVHFSKEWEKMLGYSEDEISNNFDEWKNKLHPEDEQKTYSDLNKYLNKEIDIYTNEHRLLCKNGTYKWILDKGKIIEYSKDGKPSRMIGTHTDISEIKELEVKYKSLLDFTPDIVYEFSNKKGAIYWSKAVKKILGFTMNDLVKNPFLWTNSIVDEDKEKVKIAIQGKDYNIKYRIKTKDGKIKWLHDIFINKKTIGDEILVYGHASDITEQVEAQQKLETANKKLEAIFNSFNHLVYIIDKNNKIKFMNNKLIEKIGEENIGKKCYKAIYNRDSKCPWCVYDKLNEEQPTISFDLFNNHWKEYMNITNILFDKVKKLTINFDVTERINAEKALKESEENYKTLVNSLNEGIWHIDKNGITTFANPQMEKILGYEKDEMIGKSFFEFMEKTEIEKANKYFENRKQGISEKHEFELKSKNGKNLTLNLNTTALFNESNEFIGALAAVTDITQIKKDELALKESEERFKSLFYNNKTVSLIIDPENQKIIDANNTAVEYYGYSKEELLNLKMSDINTLPSHEIEALMQDAIKKGLNYFEFEHKLADGKIKNVNVYNGLITISNKKLIYAIVIDITDRKNAELKLKESEEKFRTVVENSPLVTFVLDDKGVFTLSEGMGLKKLGLKPGQVVGLSAFDVYKDFPTILNAIKKAQKGEALREEVDIHGIVFDVLYNPVFNKKGNVTKIIGVANDITERKKAELELKENEEKFRLLVKNQGEGVGITDEEETFIFANPAAEEIFGCKNGELIGKKLNQFLDNKNYEIIKNQTDLRKKDFKSNYELQITQKNGKKVQLLVTATPFSDSIARIEGTLAIFRDITNLKKQEQELKELLATKNRFFNIIAHDLRSPFNALLGFSELLYTQHNTFTEDKIEMMSKALYETSKNLFELVENLLTWSRSQSGKLKFEPQECYLDNIIQNPISGTEIVAKNKNIIIEKEISKNVKVIVDKNLIDTVIRNLISNAIKFTKPHGKIKISTKVIEDYIQVSIKDNGVGIEENRLHNLFKIDTTTSTQGTENEQGTGLGLILSKEFVEKHGGKMWVESQPGVGSTFYFTIPIAK